MKIFGVALPKWYELGYLAIAIATFKHSSWAYSITMEGAAPVVDWEHFSPNATNLWAAGTLMMWFFWGGLMAIAIDVTMFFSSREIRRGNKFHILTFAVAALFSAATQLIYAATHAVELTYIQTALTALREGTGWVWNLSEYRLVYLPVSLPLTATIYTVAILFSDEQRRKKGLPTSADDPSLQATFTAREAAQVSGRNYNYVLALCKRGIIGRKADDGVNWVLTTADLRRLNREGVHRDDS